MIGATPWPQQAMPSEAAQAIMALATIAFSAGSEYPTINRNGARRTLYGVVQAAMRSGMREGPRLLTALRAGRRDSQVIGDCERVGMLVTADEFREAVAAAHRRTR